jgi:hypothetical protein
MLIRNIGHKRLHDVYYSFFPPKKKLRSSDKNKVGEERILNLRRIQKAGNSCMEVGRDR